MSANPETKWAEKRSFEFRLHTDIQYGPGISSRLPEFLNQFGYRRLALVVDAGIMNNPTYRSMRQSLGTECEVVHELINAVSEPDYDYLEQCRNEYADKVAKLDCFVAVGGGSTLDLAKAISVLLTNPRRAIEYRGFNLIENPGVPLVAAPTTAGTGSEVTPNAVFTDSHERRRLGINTPLYVPKLALLDPLLTVTCPRGVTINSGLDALMQAIETYVSTKASPTSRLFSKQAFSLVFNTLPKVVRQPEDVGLRGNMQLGAYYSAIALFNSASGPAGALSYPLDVFFHVPHGLAHGMFQPSIVRWNIEHGCNLYADLYELIEGAEITASPPAKSVAFHERLSKLYAELDIPRSLTTFGVSRRDSSFLAEQAFGLRTSIDFNPVEMSVADVTRILESMT